MQLTQASYVLQKARLDYELFDDFFWYISPHMWTSLAADANSSVAIDADDPGGVVVINTGDSVDNNEAALPTTNELVVWAADKPWYAEARIQYSEINTSAANVAFGFADAMGANLITDDGAGVGINSSGALIYKLDGGTVWRANTENNSVTTDTVSTSTAGGSSYQRLGIESIPVDGTNHEVTFFLDGRPLRDSNNRAIKHTVAYASATDMDFGVYAKAGAANALTVKVDYVYFCRRR